MKKKGIENLNKFLDVAQLLSDGVSEFEPMQMDWKIHALSHEPGSLCGIYMWGKIYIEYLNGGERDEELALPGGNRGIGI